MADLTTLRTRLEEAEEALHKVVTGGQEVSLASGDSQVTYNRTNANELRKYIADLTVQVREAEGVSRAGSRRMEVVW